jgi:hypothetical protein
MLLCTTVGHAHCMTFQREFVPQIFTQVHGYFIAQYCFYLTRSTLHGNVSENEYVLEGLGIPMYGIRMF